MVDAFDPEEKPGALAGLTHQDSQPDDVVLVLSNAPDVMLAKRIAHILVEESLVACAQVGSPMTSMYLWQGKLEGSTEIPLTFKTTATLVPALYLRLCQLHPYEIPEFLIQGIAAVSQPYQQWVRGNVRPSD
ncbi:divalent-cation tolerance protein CutA [Castellaniella sp.]|uniref:divalent-cation tolerance protein CutA n=1 Tax=Castellaniella sp. TaxID=1955812 RepID=UPI002AFEC81E|nr:divalent-cation tolerance protein CutA [Castellaniella sp.]